MLANRWCANQAFAIGPHLGMQCHIELTQELIRNWCDSGRREIERSRASPGVQPVDEILSDLDRRVEALHATADRA